MILKEVVPRHHQMRLNVKTRQEQDAHTLHLSAPDNCDQHDRDAMQQ